MLPPVSFISVIGQRYTVIGFAMLISASSPLPLPAVKQSNVWKNSLVQDLLVRFRLFFDAMYFHCRLQLILIDILLPLCTNPPGAFFICLHHVQQTHTKGFTVFWTIVPVPFHNCIPEFFRCPFHLDIMFALLVRRVDRGGSSGPSLAWWNHHRRPRM